MLKLFDVTLRDGLQSVSKIYNLTEKKEILRNIILKRPQAIEIGSLVSSKILPQMNNSLELYQEGKEYNAILGNSIDLYLLIPNLKGLELASMNNIDNFSFITSVSDSFQKKNIGKTLVETKGQLRQMIQNDIITADKKIKLYISCITDCPIQGKINYTKIIDEILYYYYSYENLDELCLSDTCGTLQYDKFKLIIKELEKRQVNINKISLHLHNQENKQNIQDIILYAMKKGIYRFDVSNMPELGGCSVTMKNTKGNLSYEQIYNCL
jgi:hydroxymethylglutaryl-CoA lyase